MAFQGVPGGYQVASGVLQGVSGFSRVVSEGFMELQMVPGELKSVSWGSYAVSGVQRGLKVISMGFRVF